MRVGLVAAVVLLGVGGVARAQQLRGERLVWADEFDGAGGVPDAANWGFETGGDGWGNHELETYCAPGSVKAPCAAGRPNVVVADGYLHIVARRDAAGAVDFGADDDQGAAEFSVWAD